MYNLKFVKKLTDLVIYQIAEEIILDIEKLCHKENLKRKFVITDHLIKTAVSIAANIAEGFGRYYFRENKNFLFYARGSLEETKCRLRHLTLAGYLAEDETQSVFIKLESLGVKINNTIQTVNKQISAEDQNNQQRQQS